MEFDNSASRLLAILQAGKRQPREGNCRQQWHVILQTENNESKLMSSLGKVMALPMQILNELNEHYQPHQIHASHWMSKLDASFANQQFHSQWATFIDHIDDHTISYLSNSAMLLEGKSLTKVISAEELASLKTLFSELIEEVLKSEQPKELKFFVIKNLKKIVEAIDDYRLTGSLPLIEAMDATIGHCAFNNAYKEFMFKSSIGTKIAGALQNLANVATVATGYAQLAPVTGSTLMLFGRALGG